MLELTFFAELLAVAMAKLAASMTPGQGDVNFTQGGVTWAV